MANIWIHRKCARPKSEEYAGDELILPKQVDETRVRICEVCKEYKPTLGAVYLHKGDEVNWTTPGETVEATREEIAESIPDEVVGKMIIETVKAIEAENVEEPEIPLPSTPTESQPTESPSSTEKPVEAESEPSVTLEVEVDTEKAKATLDELESQIAKLQAKKDALKK